MLRVDGTITFYITDASGDGRVIEYDCESETRERYDKIETILTENYGNSTTDTAWEALEAASQAPNPEDVTSNTQWSIVYHNTDLTVDVVIRRDWDTHTFYDLTTNQWMK